MIQFAVSKGLNVRSTTFPHKDIHKETRYSETVGQRIKQTMSQLVIDLEVQ